MVWHSRLTVELVNQLEGIQITCLKVILGDNYSRYNETLEMWKMDTLNQRRETRCIKFAKKCQKHPANRRLFPQNKNKLAYMRKTEINWPLQKRTKWERECQIPTRFRRRRFQRNLKCTQISKLIFY